MSATDVVELQAQLREAAEEYDRLLASALVLADEMQRDGRHFGSFNAPRTAWKEIHAARAARDAARATTATGVAGLRRAASGVVLAEYVKLLWEFGKDVPDEVRTAALQLLPEGQS